MLEAASYATLKEERVAAEVEGEVQEPSPVVDGGNAEADTVHMLTTEAVVEVAAHILLVGSSALNCACVFSLVGYMVHAVIRSYHTIS